MNQDNNEDVIEVVEKIKRYLSKNPHAADTSEGVMQWLAIQKYEDTLILVNKALNVLVDEKIVSKSSLKDGTVVYRRFS